MVNKHLCSYGLHNEIYLNVIRYILEPSGASTYTPITSRKRLVKERIVVKFGTKDNSNTYIWCTFGLRDTIASYTKMGYIYILTLWCWKSFGVTHWSCLKMALTYARVAVCAAKRTKIEDSWTLVTHLWGTLHVLVFNLVVTSYIFLCWVLPVYSTNYR